MKNGKLKITEEVIVQYCKGQSRQEDLTFIENEIQMSDELSSRVVEMKKIIALEEDIQEHKSIHTGLAFSKIKRAIQKPAATLRVLRFISRYAAAFILPLLLTTALFSYLYFQQVNQPVTYAEINTPSGTMMRYELPDKSMVWLNANSKLRYPTRFKGKTREVELWGEGFFEVKANLERPFYVKTEDGSKVFAYGTRFNVSSYGDDAYVETVLEEGKVNVITPGGDKTVTLQPGERACYNKTNHEISVKEVGLYAKLAWMDGKLVFRNASLESIVKRLSRYYNVDIRMEGQANKKHLFRATFSNESIFQILDYLKMSAPIEWSFVEPVKTEDETGSRKAILLRLKDK